MPPACLWRLIMLKLKLHVIAIPLLILSSYDLYAQTWCPPMRVSPEWDTSLTYYAARYCGMTKDNSGTPWCAWCAEEFFPLQYNIYVSHYSDTAWSDPDTIYPFLGFTNCNLATDANGNVWVVAEEVGSAISACFYDGNSWSDLMSVPTPGSCCHYPVATGDSLGNLWVCWHSGGPGDGHHIWGNAYIQGQWGSPVLISYPGSHDESAYSMTTDKQGNVWVGWSGAFYRSIKLCASFNNGSTWSDTMVIAEYSTWTCGPALTVDTSGKVWAGWLNRGVSEWNVYANYYDGSIWSEPRLVSSDTSTPFPYVGDWPIAITSDDAGMVWLTWMNPDTNIYYSYWNDSTWSNPAPVDIHPAKDCRPKMTFDGERIWVTWIRWLVASGWDTLSVYASYTYGVGIEEKPVVQPPPSGLGLWQNYPNPFRDKIYIKFQILNSKLQTTIKIYNCAGQLVRSFNDLTRYQSSINQIFWDGRDEAGRKVSSGVYFIQLKTPDCEETKKVILLR